MKAQPERMAELRLEERRKRCSGSLYSRDRHSSVGTCVRFWIRERDGGRERGREREGGRGGGGNVSTDKRLQPFALPNKDTRKGTHIHLHCTITSKWRLAELDASNRGHGASAGHGGPSWTGVSGKKSEGKRKTFQSCPTAAEMASDASPRRTPAVPSHLAVLRHTGYCQRPSGTNSDKAGPQITAAETD